MSDKYPKSSGALFTNQDKKQENHPDFRGNIEVTGEQIKKLIEMGRAGLEPKLSVSGWWRVAATTGATYMSLQGEAYMKDAEAQQYPQGQQQAPVQPPAGAPQGNGQYQPVQQGQVPQQPQYQQAPVPQQPAPAQPAPEFDISDDDIPF